MGSLIFNLLFFNSFILMCSINVILVNQIFSHIIPTSLSNYQQLFAVLYSYLLMEFYNHLISSRERTFKSYELVPHLNLNRENSVLFNHLLKKSFVLIYI